MTIADREADIFELLAEADELDAEYAIRAAQDRRVDSGLGRPFKVVGPPELKLALQRLATRILDGVAPAADSRPKLIQGSS